MPGRSPWIAVVTLLCGLLVTLWAGWQVGLYLMMITAIQGGLTVLLKVPIRNDRPLDG